MSRSNKRILVDVSDATCIRNSTQDGLELVELSEDEDATACATYATNISPFAKIDIGLHSTTLDDYRSQS